MEREVLEFDVQFVGAGPAGLGGAIHLANLIAKHDQAIAAGAPGNKLGEVTIAVLEKSKHVGAHGLSGAVMDPRAMNELFPNWKELGAPLNTAVAEDRFLFLTETGSVRFPNLLLPACFVNHGNYIVSLGNVCRWLGQQAERAESHGADRSGDTGPRARRDLHRAQFFG